MLVIAQGLQLLPKGLYYLGFIVALLGSLILLIAHAVRQPEVRRDLRFLLVAVFLALIPSIGIGLASGIVSIPPGVSSLGLLSFPLIPFGYLYATYRRQLGEFELRLNRLISLYLFLILLGTLMVPLVVVTTTRIQSPEGTMVLEITGGLLVILITVFGFPLFQNFMERRWLGIRLSPENLLEVYSARITTSSSLSGLVQLLRDEVLPSLLVRQFVFLQFDGNSTKVLLATGAIAEDIPVGPGLSPLMAQMGKYCFPHLSDSDPSWPWVRLVIPLRIGEGIIGLWLFGRRDPDDVYSQAELPILRSLADQTAIALSNILQTERLRALYQANINRYEQERFRLALDLHDSVLNQAAAMLMNLDSSSLSPGFQEAYDRFTQRLREIVSDLRPPMLNYGLKPALEALADNLMERSGDTVSVVVNVQADEVSYPQNIEQHLFRIVQEACENALRHGQARRISISGQLGAQEVDLSIEDDGIGFDMGQGLELEDLLAHKHFGLAGMVERARLLDAEINIATAPRAGTRIRVTWNSSVG
ncbi:MAG: ATP-binding protein [Anaerolineales bacterium]|nr:ATP-binding protein [Anaerolineales bacterium]